ncbi:MAG: VOC family protein [Pigmentiphaga sp.]
MKITRISHIAIATDSLNEMKSVFGNLLGLPVVQEARFESGTELAMYDAGNLQIEVMHNPSPASVPGRFVHDNGPGYFHICLEVEHLGKALEELAAKGVRILDSGIQKGAGGGAVTFLDPTSTGGLLIELSQAPDTENDDLACTRERRIPESTNDQ